MENQYLILPAQKFEQLCSDVESLKTILQNGKPARRNDPAELIKRSELLEMLDISSKTEWLMRKRNALPFVQYGKKILYRRSDVEKFIERNGN